MKHQQINPFLRNRRLHLPTPGQVAGKIVVYGFLLFIFIITFFPFWQIFVLSVNDAGDSLRGGLLLMPRELNLSSYKAVFQNEEILSSLGVTVARTIIGVPLTVFCVAMLAYVLSKKELVHRSAITFFFVFTMYFSGGLIPTYLVVSKLHLLNTPWAMMIPGAVSIYNVIITRTYFVNSIPSSLQEAAELDGCSDFKFFTKIAIPLSMPIIAVLCLWVAVALWNGYFNPLIYINSQEKYPLQLVLRRILLMSQVDFGNSAVDPKVVMENQFLSQMLRYGTIIISSLPLMIIYPFVQKYFVKGVMIGSVKG